MGQAESPWLGDRYRAIRQLGNHAGRQTWLAEDRQTHQPVVVKRLLFGPEFEWDDLKLFEREAETLKSLSHPAIPRYLDFFELDEPNGRGFALVQSYIKARSLQNYLESGRTFSEEEVKQIATALLNVLIYLQDRIPPVIHRDIKPSNILLGDRTANSPGDVYLVDFGSVQTLSAREGRTVTVVGTYGYMPPEQFGGRTVPASDLYSLGATMIYLVTGTNPADLPQKELRVQFEAIATCSNTFTEWVRSMTSPGLQERPDSARSALELLENPKKGYMELSQASTLIVQRPINTVTRLIKTDDILEIDNIPMNAASAIGIDNTSTKLNDCSIFYFVLSMMPVLVGFAWLAGLYSSIIPVLFGGPFALLLFLLYIRYYALKSQNDSTKLRIDRQSIQWIRKDGDREVSILFDSKSSKVCLSVDKRLHPSYGKPGAKEFPALCILCDPYFTLRGDKRITEEEILWLAQELGAWFDEPIIIDGELTYLSGNDDERF